jgi:hypothetical protein
MFLQDGQFIVVTLEADAAQWENEQPGFDIVRSSLRLQPVDEQSGALAAPAPAAEPNSPADGAASAREGAGEETGNTGSFESNSGGESGATEGGD